MMVARRGAVRAKCHSAQLTIPDMRRLSAELHGMGLKVGIYLTPWRATLSRHNGSSADNINGIDDWIASHDYNEFFQYQVPQFDSWLIILAKPLADRLRKRKRQRFTGEMKRPASTRSCPRC